MANLPQILHPRRHLSHGPHEDDDPHSIRGREGDTKGGESRGGHGTYVGSACHGRRRQRRQRYSCRHRCESRCEPLDDGGHRQVQTHQKQIPIRQTAQTNPLDHRRLPPSHRRLRNPRHRRRFLRHQPHDLPLRLPRTADPPRKIHGVVSLPSLRALLPQPLLSQPDGREHPIDLAEGGRSPRESLLGDRGRSDQEYEFGRAVFEGVSGVSPGLHCGDGEEGMSRWERHRGGEGEVGEVGELLELVLRVGSGVFYRGV
mmetsp:Transcript_2991/g.6074  ORF Transcript_2991/g.6074 Transcript_2991/m.6074 type:complete len:258 (+) Transcript_2991:252-1025(+)